MSSYSIAYYEKLGKKYLIIIFLPLLCLLLEHIMSLDNTHMFTLYTFPGLIHLQLIMMVYPAPSFACANCGTISLFKFSCLACFM